MGAAGAGKTTIGAALAAELGWPFVDGDDRHPRGNVEKMHAGLPLTDADRAPWLASLRATMACTLERREHLVLACSALKRTYRESLRGDLRGVRFVYLKASEAALLRRLSTRTGHFAGPNLLQSQLAALEEPSPDEAWVIDATWPRERILGAIRREFGI